MRCLRFPGVAMTTAANRKSQDRNQSRIMRGLPTNRRRYDSASAAASIPDWILPINLRRRWAGPRLWDSCRWSNWPMTGAELMRSRGDHGRSDPVFHYRTSVGGSGSGESATADMQTISLLILFRLFNGIHFLGVWRNQNQQNRQQIFGLC